MTDAIDANRVPFTEEDERRIASAATWGIVVAITSITTGAVSLLMQGTVMLENPVLLELGMARSMMLIPIVQAAITVLINLWLLQASLAFRKVALTDEADQAYLLQGFRKLRAYFMVQVILIVLAIGLGILITVLGPRAFL